jgi:hypothetical protein
MINTQEIKIDQFAHGTFRLGTGPKTILIVGSCRSVPYLTYLGEWNAQNGNPFSIHFLDPFNWNWNMEGVRVDYHAELIKQEANAQLLETLSKTSIFIHEYYANAEMFNCDKNAEKNIYQFGLNPEVDICTPNFNDVFILTSDILRFHPEVMKIAVQDYNVNGKLSDQTLKSIEDVRISNLVRFMDICSKTDFPEFAEIFMNDYKHKRFFWTFNHTSKLFAQTLFRLMNDKFLKLDLSNYQINEIDLYENPRTYLTEYDLGYTWNEEVKPLRDIIQ